MKGKTFGIGCIILILTGSLIGLSFKSGFKTTSVVNPMSEYSSISELQNSVSFEFQIPAVVINGENLKLNNYMDNMIEIQSEDMVFRAAPFLDNGADVSGEYSDSEVDERFRDSEGLTSIRYRQLNNGNTVINLDTNNISYSIKFKEQLSKEDAFKILDIDITKLLEQDENQIKQENIKNTDKIEGRDEVENIEGADNAKDVAYKKIQNDDMGVEFMLPVLESKISSTYDNNKLIILIEDEIAFIIEYYKDGYDKSNEEFRDYTIKEIDTNYLVRYVVSNKFEKGSQPYKDYYTLIESIDTLADTFKS